jgi:uncharacterized membrane protein
MLRPPSSTTERLEAFSDGVIAIAITLLVLEIHVPHVEGDESLWHELLEQWPSYVAFILSFVTIGIMWVSHHSMFERIGLVDRKLLFINLLLLMGIAFLPFPTSLVASYVREGGTNSHVAAAIYSMTLVLIGIAFSSMWWHLVQRPWLLAPGVPTDRTRLAFKRSMIGPGLYLLTVGLAFISAPACFVAYALISLYFAAGPSSRVVTPADPGELDRGSP